MEFKNKINEWQNPGAEPSSELQKTGFQGGYKPPAGIFNWFWNKVTKCINELQQKLTDVDDTKADKSEIEKSLAITTYSQLDEYWLVKDSNTGEWAEDGSADEYSIMFKAQGKIFGGQTDTDEALCVMRVMISGDTFYQKVTVMRGDEIYEYKRVAVFDEEYQFVGWENDDFELADTYAKKSMFTYGTEDLTAGSSRLETGKLYFVYE